MRLVWTGIRRWILQRLCRDGGRLGGDMLCNAFFAGGREMQRRNAALLGPILAWACVGILKLWSML